MRIGEVLRAGRVAAGLSLDTMAQRAHFSKPHLSNVETGKRLASPEVIAAYAHVLGVPEESLTRPLPDPLRRAHEWLVSDSPQTIERLSGRRVGAGLAADVETRVIDLRHLDDHVGGEDLAPVVAKELDDTAQLVRGASFTDPVGRRLLTSVGELSQLAGWVASDAGLYDQAARHYLSGVSAANEAGDHPLAANLFSSLSYQMANVGRPADALLLARSAMKGADGATPTTRALLLERVAWSAAKARDAGTAIRVLDQVDDVYENRSSGDADPEWVYWLNRDEISTMRARVMVELGKPSEAEPLLVGVLSRYPAESYREQSLYWSWLAEAYAKAGELDQGRAALGKAADYAARVNSSRTADRLTVVMGLLTP
ncbi:helix-turn-helix domain-containing protein [Catenulispora rubra]|uniref:helix-turn-helix domain-containing protein n=1 Tax=Catenulispora rubra TaxID=280293 RepID=UPI003F6A0CDE